MAVEKMQLVHVFGSMKEFSRAADKIYDAGSFHPENTKEFLGKFETIVPFDSRNPHDHELSSALEALSLAGIEPEKVDFSDIKYSVHQIEDICCDCSCKLSGFIQMKTEYEQAIAKSEYAISFLEPLSSLEVPLAQLLNFEFITVRLGKMPAASSEKYKLFILQNEDVFFFPFREDKEFVYGMYIAPKASIEKADAVFNSLSFEQLPATEHLEGTPKDTIAMLNGDIERMRADIAKVEEDLKACAETNKDQLLKLYSKARHDYEVYKLMTCAAHSQSTFYLVGWMPKREADAFVNSFESLDGLMCRLVTDKEEEIECPEIAPPTKLRNFALFRPFEMFLKMYALPSYGEMDPTPLMAIAYSILFGVMFGDVGQGAVIFLVGLFLGFKKKMDLGKIMVCVGVFSIIFGFIYGSVFGYEDIIHGKFHAMDKIKETLEWSVILGMVMVVFMILLNMINGIRQKNFGKVVFSPNGIVGLLFYVGIIAIVRLLFNIGDINLTPWFLIVFIALPLVLIHICTRKKWQPESKSMYFVENFFELIEVFLSALTNTLSFIRVGAFALNHIGMMMVIFILAQTDSGGDNMIAVVIGNLVVIALEGLIVGIQVLRLNYYEFFSRFYEGNGREFEPVSINYKKNSI